MSSAVNLEKGGSFNLNKSTHGASGVCVGLNWSGIPGKTFFGLMNTTKDVDLDGSVAVFDANKNLIDTIYFKNLKSKDGAIRHSGDDLTGDWSGDDGRDNETIIIDFTKLSDDAHSIFVFLNSYQKQDFGMIPYSKIRIYIGTPRRVDEILAYFNLSAQEEFADHVSMIMGKFQLSDEGDWHFEALGTPAKTARVFDTVDLIRENFL